MRNTNNLQDLEKTEGGTNLTTEEARQGETSGHVRAVLAASLSAALIAMGLVYLIFFG